MDPDGVAPLLLRIGGRAEAAAVPVANAMARAYKDHLVGFTLRESGTHDPVTQTPAPPGRPPAWMEGTLAGSVKAEPAVGGGGVATSSVAPHTIYAATQEYGGTHYAKPGGFMWLWVKYIGPYAVASRGWKKTEVEIPERPYMRTATAETIADGQLHRAAIAAAVPFLPH